MPNFKCYFVDRFKRISFFFLSEIIELVKQGPVNCCPPFRPVINECAFDDLNNIMTRCWKEDPNERPDFGILKTIIRKVNK